MIDPLYPRNVVWLIALLQSVSLRINSNKSRCYNTEPYNDPSTNRFSHGEGINVISAYDGNDKICLAII